MKVKRISAAILCGALALAGCENMSTDGMVDSGLMAMKAATLSDSEVQTLSDQACSQMDERATLAQAGSDYSERLERVAARLGGSVEGVSISYRVYEEAEPNAWAMANGCVRVHTALLDLMNDDELAGVLGHEIGHVVLGHSKKAMQTAYAASAARRAAAASGNSAVETLSSSQLGALGEALINAQFSQAQESAADDFSFDLLSQRGLDRQALVSAFEKLAQLEAGQGSSMLSSHPGAQKRAQRMRERLAKG